MRHFSITLNAKTTVLLKRQKRRKQTKRRPTGQATKAELSIKVNAKREPDLTTTTTGVTIGERKLGEETAKPYTYTWEISFAEVETFDLTFTLTNSSNLRIDDVKLVVTEAGGASSSDNGSGIPDYDPITGFTW